MSAPAVSPVRALVPAHLSVAQRVRLTAYAMVVASLGLKAWVVLPAWFYSDDFRFIEDAHTHGMSIDFLFTPHDSQLMPVGVAISWLVAQADGYSWLTAASITLALQARRGAGVPPDAAHAVRRPLGHPRPARPVRGLADGPGGRRLVVRIAQRAADAGRVLPARDLCRAVGARTPSALGLGAAGAIRWRPSADRAAWRWRSR